MLRRPVGRVRTAPLASLLLTRRGTGTSGAPADGRPTPTPHHSSSGAVAASTASPAEPQRARPAHPGGPHRLRRPRATTRLSEAESAEAGSLPMVHPGATHLPPLSGPTHPRSKFSFLSDPRQKQDRDYTGVGAFVPNDKPKPRLPMWASSLTSPALGKQRLVEENWISTDAMGTLGQAETAAFEDWLLSCVGPAGRCTLQGQLRETIMLHLRRSFQRGVYARRDLAAGEVVLSLPLTGLSPTTAPQCLVDGGEGAAHMSVWGTALNVDTLRAHSAAVRARRAPTYAEVKAVLDRTRRSTFDPTPHPLFVDQVCTALMLACERAAGEASPLHPYLRLLAGDGEGGFDDEHIRELHLGVLDPVTHMEYNDHRNRFTHQLRELHKAWWDSYEEELRLRRQPQRSLTSGSTAVSVPPSAELAAGGGEHVGGMAGSRAHDAGERGGLSSAPLVEPLGVGAAAVTPTGGAHGHDLGDATLTGIATTWEGRPPLAAARMSEGGADTALQPPPSLQDLLWAFRVVLSRQRMLPGLRGASTATMARESTQAGHEEVNESLDRFGQAVMRGKWAFYGKVLRAVDEDRLRVNAYDPRTIATLVPLLDMFQHPAGGVANARFTVEELPLQGDAEAGAGTHEDAGSVGRPHVRVPHIVLRTTEEVAALDELTLQFSRCYSVSYSLYRFGFLPLRNREDDITERLLENGVDGEYRPLPSGHSLGPVRAGLRAVRQHAASLVARVRGG